MRECARQWEQDDIRPAVVSAAANDWLAVVPYQPEQVSEDPPAQFSSPLERVPGREYLALVSFPDPAAPEAPGRCYLYDSALALLWYAATAAAALTVSRSGSSFSHTRRITWLPGIPRT